MEVVNLGDAAVAAPAAVRGPDGSPALHGHCHLCRGQRAAGHASQRIEDGGAALVELGEEAACIGGELLLLLGEQPSELLVPACASSASRECPGNEFPRRPRRRGTAGARGAGLLCPGASEFRTCPAATGQYERLLVGRSGLRPDACGTPRPGESYGVTEICLIGRGDGHVSILSWSALRGQRSGRHAIHQVVSAAVRWILISSVRARRRAARQDSRPVQQTRGLRKRGARLRPPNGSARARPCVRSEPDALVSEPDASPSRRDEAAPHASIAGIVWALEQSGEGWINVTGHLAPPRSAHAPDPARAGARGGDCGS
jgi:hypothetical protein